MPSLWKFTRDLICSFEFFGGMLMQLAIINHFHFDFMESTLLGGGFGMLISNFILKKGRPVVINIELPPFPQKNNAQV